MDKERTASGGVRQCSFDGLSLSGKYASQQTQNICITIVQRGTNVEDVGPALYKCYTNVLCLLGPCSLRQEGIRFVHERVFAHISAVR